METVAIAKLLKDIAKHSYKKGWEKLRENYTVVQFFENTGIVKPEYNAGFKHIYVYTIIRMCARYHGEEKETLLKNFFKDEDVRDSFEMLFKNNENNYYRTILEQEVHKYFERSGNRGVWTENRLDEKEIIEDFEFLFTEFYNGTLTLHQERVEKKLDTIVHEIKTLKKPAVSLNKEEILEIKAQYCEIIKKKFATLHLFGYGKKTGTIEETIRNNRMIDVTHGFIPLYVSDWQDEAGSLNPERLDLDDLFLNNSKQKRFLVRGLPGSGKTTLLRYLCYRYTRQCIEKGNDRIPIYIRLRDYRDKDDQGTVSIEELINRTFKMHIEDYDLLKAIEDQNLLEKNKLIVLLDGIDEIRDEETGKNIMNTINDFVTRHPHCTIILASRPINLKRRDYPKFHALDINPLTPDMYREYIDKWFNDRDDKKAVLLDILRTKPRIAELAGNPFLLSMICYTFDTDEKKIVQQRSELYKTCTEELLKKSYDIAEEQGGTVGIRHGGDKPKFDQIIETLKYISFLFFQWQEGDFIAEYVTIMGKRNPKSGNPDDTIELLADLERDTGIVQRTENGFAFIHQSLWEYFTALALLDKNCIAAIHQAANPDWEEVIRLYAGLLSHDGQKEKLEGLIQGLWTINRPLALRVTTEVDISAHDCIRPLIDKEEGNQSRLLLIDSVEQSLPLIEKTRHKTLVNETLRILLIECGEKDCEVIYHCHELLERLQLQPLEKGGLIYELLDLSTSGIRQDELLKDPENCFQWIEIMGGSYQMGDNKGEEDEHPEHPVNVQDFFIAKYPVTNRLMEKACFPFGNRYPEYGGASNPAIGNTWFEAYYFALWLGARLPTEAQWEYAARGGSKSRGFRYSGSNTVEEVAWYLENSGKQSHPVGEKEPNESGVNDMSGNVWEWCSDWYGSKYYERCEREGTVLNPKGPEKGVYRVLRGGSWSYDAVYCRSAARDGGNPGHRNDNAGFRLVRGQIENERE